VFEEEDGGENEHLMSSSLRKAFDLSFLTPHQRVGISLVHVLVTLTATTRWHATSGGNQSFCVIIF
jgi:hypothetical protein